MRRVINLTLLVLLTVLVCVSITYIYFKNYLLSAANILVMIEACRLLIENINEYKLKVVQEKT